VGLQVLRSPVQFRSVPFYNTSALEWHQSQHVVTSFDLGYLVCFLLLLSLQDLLVHALLLFDVLLVLLAQLEGPFPEDARDDVLIDSLKLQKLLRKDADQFPLLVYNASSAFRTGLHNLKDLSIDLVLHILRVLLRVLRFAILNPPQFISKAVFSHVCLSNLVGLVEVVTSSSRYLPEEYLLRDPSSKDNAYFIKQLHLRVHLMLVGKILSESECALRSRNDGKLQ
jgi:hypothetical protein